MKPRQSGSLLRLILAGFGLIGAPLCRVHAADAIPASTLPPDHVMREVSVFDFDESQDTPLAEGFRRRHLHRQQGTLAVFELKQGARVPLHQHPNEQTSYIVKGRVEITADGRITAYPGDTWNFWQPGGDPAKRFVSVNAVWADKEGNLWVVDSGRPRFGELVRGAPKLGRIDTRTDRHDHRRLSLR